MKQAGDRVVVFYPHDSNYHRVGTLISIVEQISAAEDGQRNIWEVKLDNTPRKPEEKHKYNEFWLHNLITYEEWKNKNDGSAFVNWESLNKMTDQEADEFYNGLLETFAEKSIISLSYVSKSKTI